MFFWQAPLNKAELMKILLSVGGYGTALVNAVCRNALNFHLVTACCLQCCPGFHSLYLIHYSPGLIHRNLRSQAHERGSGRTRESDRVCIEEVGGNRTCLGYMCLCACFFTVSMHIESMWCLNLCKGSISETQQNMYVLVQYVHVLFIINKPNTRWLNV